MPYQVNTVPPSPGFPQNVVPGDPMPVPPGATLQIIDTDTGAVINPGAWWLAS